MNLHELAVIGGMMFVTFGVRYVLFALGEKVSFPPLVRDALRYVPIAVLTAIVVPMVLLPDGRHWSIDWHNAWLIGAATSGLIAWLRGPLLAAILVSMAVFFAWPYLIA
ncbi:MAG: AzlD domain-containing protein [Burkholderiales bacterium]|nr:AzlD domain-containing protein [Burkholderiales bacterium]